MVNFSNKKLLSLNTHTYCLLQLLIPISWLSNIEKSNNFAISSVLLASMPVSSNFDAALPHSIKPCVNRTCIISMASDQRLHQSDELIQTKHIFSPSPLNRISKSNVWTTMKSYRRMLEDTEQKPKSAPTLYRIHLNIEAAPKDTFVNLNVIFFSPNYCVKCRPSTCSTECNCI